MSQDSRTPVIVSAARLPTGRFLGALSALGAAELGGRAIRAAVERAGVDAGEADYVIMGNVVQAGVGQAPARQAGIAGGVPAHVPAVTVNEVCGSGLKAVIHAAQAIRAGDGELYVAGGMESMSNAPYLLRNHRTGRKFGDEELVDGLIRDGLWCSFGQCHMGGHAEYTAHTAGISRQEQDEFALRSHRLAVAAADEGAFDAEMVPVEIEGRRGTSRVEEDEPPRRDTSLDRLAGLRPAFGRDAPDEVEELTVTAGNAPGLNDGAAATVVCSRAYARSNDLEVLAEISEYASGARDPQELFFAPVEAVRHLMEREGTAVDDYGLVELNEAFAVQALADIRELGMDLERVNVHGGAVALGHPIGASGARILTTLIHAMRRHDVEKGLASLCLGGGGAVAMSVELPA